MNTRNMNTDQRRDHVRRALREIVADVFDLRNVEDITDATRFREDMGADSLDYIELIMECEDGFEMDIDDMALEVEKIITFGEAADYLTAKLGE